MRKLNSTLCLPRRGWPPLPNERFFLTNVTEEWLSARRCAATLHTARQNMGNSCCKNKNITCNFCLNIHNSYYFYIRCDVTAPRGAHLAGRGGGALGAERPAPILAPQCPRLVATPAPAAGGGR